ncbi:MAG: GNAT family N-acetyltransferase [Flavobacteriales bacterium]|nr:GNAT family N-acetyltransferase [Flavobacteriales bacterium]
MGDVLGLIRELARFEKAEDQVSLTVEDLQKDGFGKTKRFQCLVSTLDSKVVGMALFYERYSTWKGATLYLEDLVVTESHRGRGIGNELFHAVLHRAQRGGYKRLEWQVLDWNEKAIGFYSELGAEFDQDWINCRIRLNESL